MGYINLPVVTDSDVMIQTALSNIADQIPGWIPREGNIEVALLEQFAIMAAEAATVASSVPDTIFKYFGSLIGITPNTGSSATIKTTWTLVGNAGSTGYTIPAGTIAGFYFSGASYEFQTTVDLTIPSGSNSVSGIVMQAVSPGSLYNIYNISGLNPYSTYLQLSSPDPNISSILITSTYGNDPTCVVGTDPETDADFLNRLTAELQLLAPRPITPSDYALFSQNVNGSGVYRAFALDGFNPLTNFLSASDANFTTAATSASKPSTWTPFANGTVSAPTLSTPGTSPNNYLQFTASAASMLSNAAITGSIVFTGNTTNTSGTISSVTSFASLSVGQTITGSGIPTGTTITSINQALGTVSISNSATATATGVSFTVSVVAGSTQLTITTTALSTTTSPTNPGLLSISDASGGGNEIIPIIGVQTSGSTQIVTLGSSITASSFAGTTASSSSTITVTSIPSGLALGQLISGTGIPTGAYVTSINTTTGTSFTISANATASGSVTITSYSNPGFNYSHAAGVATVTQLQGAMLPQETNIPANTTWYQAASVVQAAGANPETNATAKAYVVVVANYIDGSSETFSSLPQFSDMLATYTAYPKTMVCNFLSNHSETSAALTTDANVPIVYQNLDAYIVSAQVYIAFKNCTASKTHAIYYNSLNQVSLDLSATDSVTATTSSYNFIPDGTFYDYLFTNGSGSSWGYGSMPWSAPSGINVLPQLGVQLLGTGAALGSAKSVYSQVFNLQNLTSDSSSTTRTLTLSGTIDATYTGTTYAGITVTVVDANNPATVLATITPAAANLENFAQTFTINAVTDVQVRINFASTVNIPLGSSAIVSNLAVYSGSYNLFTLPEYEQDNYLWTPGGLYQPSTFNYPRNVTVVPVDVNGLAISASAADMVHDYLTAHRETNFVVQVINPNYVPIDVAWTGYVSVGYVASTVQEEVNAAIRNFLSPATWAGGSVNPPYWDGSLLTIRTLDIAGVILSVPGVFSVASVTIKTTYPLNQSFGTSDITMQGIAQLPIANIVNGALYTTNSNVYSGLG
jgi:Baseplate J-like protein